MTTRYLKKENGEYYLGINGKKLRFIFDKKEKNIVAKFKKNWPPEAIDILELSYENFNIEFENNARGRPSKNKTPKQLKRIKETKIKNIKTAATTDTSDEEEDENTELYFLPFNIGNRVKLLIDPYSSGEIINFDYSEKLVIIKNEQNNDIIKCKKNMIKKMRGRKPKGIKKNMNFQETKNYDNDDDEFLELLKYEGKMYIINKNNEVMTLNGDYVGEYINNEII